MCSWWPLPEGWLSMLLLKWEQDNSLSVSQSVIWETDGDCGRLRGSNSPCRLQVWWRPCLYSWDRRVGVHVPGEFWAHHISLVLLLYTYTIRFTWSNPQTKNTAPHVPLWPIHWPGVIRVVSELDKMLFQHETSSWASEWRVSIPATDAPTPSASYIQPSVRFCPINRWISACFISMLPISHVTKSSKMQIYPRFRNTESQQCSCQSSISLSLGHSCAQLRAQWDRCGGTCDSRVPSCQWPAMTMAPHCVGGSPRTKSGARLLCHGICSQNWARCSVLGYDL